MNAKLAAGGVALGAALFPPAGQADTFQVTTTGDDFDACDDGGCTLREAVFEAAQNPGDDVITFASGLSGEIHLDDPIYFRPLTGGAQGGLEIHGPGADVLTIDGQNEHRIFKIMGFDDPNEQVVISGLTLTGGDAGSDGHGGAIYSYGYVNPDEDAYLYAVDLTIADSVIAGNHAEDGGAIFNGPTRTSSGIGPIEPGGDLTIEGSTIAGNESDYSGGGVFHQLGGELTVRSSTLSANTAGQYGGAIFSPFADGVTISSSTISGNTAVEAIGGIATVTADVALRNTVLANSIATGDRGSQPDRSLRGAPPTAMTATQDIGTAEGSFAGEFSLVEDPGDNQIAPLGPGPILTGLDPQLGALASNGGPTQTLLPSFTSPVLDQGIAVGGQAIDQRGLARTGDLGAIGNAVGGDGTDIGSVEVQVTDCQGQGALKIDGTGADDALIGTEGPDAIAGLGGNDRADAGAGIDCASGDEGRDTVGGGGGTDRLTGGAGKDKLKGGGGKDRLSGQGGKDKLAGGGGKDRLKGGPGKDKLNGGGGKDRFNCGGGRDRVSAQAKDRVSASCEKVIERG